MTLDEHLHAFYNLLADDVAAWLEAGMAGAAAAGVARPVALAADFAPLQRAVDRIRAKTPVASGMRSAEWAEVPLQIRNRAQFSAGVTSARVVQDIQQRLERELEWRPGDGIGRDAFIRGVRQTLEAEGYETNPQGGLTDITSNRRLALIHEMQTRSARNYAKWKIDQDPSLLAAAPAQELLRLHRRKAPRDWQSRWQAAGGQLLPGGRMVAHKLDPIWRQISRFGNPWPPFDYGSGMGVEDILRDEAAELGIQPPEKPEGEREFNAHEEAEIANLQPAARDWLKERLGDQVAVVDDRVRLSPLTWRTVEEADEWAAEAYGEADVSEPEREALTAYQHRATGAQRTMAAWLRRKEEYDPEPGTLEQIEAIDAPIARSYAKNNGMAYRVVDVAADEFDVFDKAHMSTSLCLQRAFAEYGRKAKNPLIVKIYLPKGTKGIYLSQFTRPNPDSGDAEFLLQRGTMLELVKAPHLVEIEGRQIMQMSMVPRQLPPGPLKWRRPPV